MTRRLSRILMLLPPMVLIAVTAPAMAQSILVCPPHSGAFPSEPVIQSTDNKNNTTIAQIKNDQTLAVAVRACIRCGNGIVEPGEQCDTGGQSATCNATCTRSACGDGVVNTAAGEQCDDGNVVSGDGCSSTCQTEVPIICGNGVLQAGEECDDNNRVNTDFCTNTCHNAICGDGIVRSTGINLLSSVTRDLGREYRVRLATRIAHLLHAETGSSTPRQVRNAILLIKESAVPTARSRSNVLLLSQTARSPITWGSVVYCAIQALVTAIPKLRMAARSIQLAMSTIVASAGSNALSPMPPRAARIPNVGW